ncbi:Crp/Fnr family transcriptional regulator [Yeosuana sp. AK3]
MNKNFEYLNSFLDISIETFEKLQNISTFKRVEANQPIAKAGDISSKIYLLVSGLMRVYLSTESGKEFNKYFFMPLCFVGSFTSLIKREPSKLTYETLTDCKLYEIDFEAIIKLSKHDLEVSNLYNKILEHIFVVYEERILELISMDSKQRYLQLRKRIPNVDTMIPQYQIASYLSISPVQLSRIRKSLNLIH